jgi:rhodanese-related sulfurtransferase
MPRSRFVPASLTALMLALAVRAHAEPAPAGPPDTVAVARLGATQARLAVARGTAVMVDVRFPSQRALGHVQGDLAIRYDQVAQQRDQLPADKQLIFYCSCAHEEEALEAARAMPHPDDPRIAVLVGGFDAWRRAGGPVDAEASWEGVFRVVDPPRGWGKTPTERGRCRYLRDSTVAATGRASGCVICGVPDSTSTSLPGLSQRADATPLRGRTVTLTALVRTEALDGAAMLWLATEAEGGKLLSFERGDATVVTGTTSWQPVSLKIAVPDGATVLDYGLHVLGGGRAWLDEVSLVAEPVAGRPRERVAVTNPGFEE